MKHLQAYLLTGILIILSSSVLAADITVYSSDGNGNIDKPVVLVEGFDPFNDIRPETYTVPTDDGGTRTITGYYDRIPQDFRNFLQQTGRDLVFITFEDTHLDLRQLADEFQISLIAINNMKTGNHPTAVIGYSAGGLIARWGLKEMENQATDHETSLFISYDTPHRGATIPESVIDGLKDLKDKLPSDIFGIDVEPDSLKNNWDAVNSFSSKQMLIGASYSIFLSEIETLGYPNNLARMAVANGSITGTNQALPTGAIVFDYKVEIAQISNEYQTLKQEAQFPCSYPCDPTISRDYDRAPGGTRNTFQQYWNALENVDEPALLYDLDVYFKNPSLTSHSFVNTLSAFDIKNFDILSPVTNTMKDYGPFDDYAANAVNTPHHIIDSSFANAGSGKINLWLTNYHKANSTIPNRSHKKTPLGAVTGLLSLWVRSGRNDLQWTSVPGATHYQILGKTMNNYNVLKTVSSTVAEITVSVTTQIAVRACNADQCGYPDFGTAQWRSSSTHTH